MPIIAQNAAVYTEIVVFSVLPEKQQALADVIMREVNRWIRHHVGFLSTSCHLSLDGTEVVQYTQWASEGAWSGFNQDPEQQVLREKIIQVGILARPDTNAYAVQQVIEAPHHLAPVVTPPLENTHLPEDVRMHGESGYTALSGEQTGQVFFLLRGNEQPGAGPGLHVHTREDETWFIIEGEYEFQIGDKTLCVGPGTVLFGPRDVPHKFRNIGNTEGRVLIFVNPAGLESFFPRLEQLIRENPPDPVKIATLAQQYGITLLE